MGRNWGSWGQPIPKCALKARQRGSDISGVVLMRAEIDNGDPVIVSTYSLTLNDGFVLNVKIFKVDRLPDKIPLLGDFGVSKCQRIRYPGTRLSWSR